MDVIISKSHCTDIDLENEIVERKGVGHPDTLADALAEELSIKYSLYTRERFGAVLHHNFDKVGLLGGSSHVEFGKGYLIKPIRVLLNGRASTKFGDTTIPVEDLLYKWTREFFKNSLPNVNPDTDLEFHYNMSNQSSPGKTDNKEARPGKRKYWFEPRGLFDLQEHTLLVSNDTSLGVGYFPYFKLERFVLNIEKKLNSQEYKKNHPWIGSDIKIMGMRNNNNFSITLCIPQIANQVKNVNEYKNNLDDAKTEINRIAKSEAIDELELNVNTRDDFSTLELYLTATGSSLESGDEGLVGRGNRVNGLITPYRPMSMEGACGKNPVYHIGKIYYVAAFSLAQKIFEKFGIKNQVAIISQSGRKLVDPWKVIVSVQSEFSSDMENELKKLVSSEMMKIPNITNKILDRELVLN